jgi:hypothetical protein
MYFSVLLCNLRQEQKYLSLTIKFKKMKRFTLALLTIISIAISCKSTGSMAVIQPKQGAIELPEKGEFRIWKDVSHPSFTVTLSNPSATQSCEVYTVKSSGSEKWISPSLQAGKTLSVTVPANGHLFFKNFNPNILKIDYKVEE